MMEKIINIFRMFQYKFIFELMSSFEFKVPDNYNHDIQLSVFALYAASRPKEFHFFDRNISDVNCSGATRRLIPGRTYRADIFGIKKPIISTKCLAFLAVQNAILVGAQGLSLIYQLKKESLTFDKLVLSFDEEEALWTDEIGILGVPLCYVNKDGTSFAQVKFCTTFRDGYCLLCVSELSTNA